MSEFIKKYGGLVALAGLAGAAGVYAATGALEDSNNGITTQPFAAGMSQVRINPDACTVSGNTGRRMTSHDGQTFNFARGTLTQRWRTGGEVTAFADLPAEQQPQVRAAHALLPTSASCPPPVFVRGAPGT